MSTRKRIDFSNPFNGRKWLLTLNASNKFGLLFRENLEYKKDHLGFSFKSNHIGLRGPSDVASDIVVCGTSFAMGLSVDNGLNWYDLIDSDSFFNIGMPVSAMHHQAILDEFYCGSYKRVIFLYHPNIYVTSKGFEKSIKLGINIFKEKKWKTTIPSVLALYIRWMVNKYLKRRSGDHLYINVNKEKYFINTSYSNFHSEKNGKFISKLFEDYRKLFKQFNDVHVIRVPIKEQIALDHINNPKLHTINQQYENLWSQFNEHVCEKVDANVIDVTKCGYFKIDNYLPYDTHWSESGNQVFAEIIKKQKLLV